MVDGKPQNAFGMDEKAMDRDYTLKVRPPRPPLDGLRHQNRLTRPLARRPFALPREPLARPLAPARPCSPLLTLSRPRRAGDTKD